MKTLLLVGILLTGLRGEAQGPGPAKPWDTLVWLGPGRLWVIPHQVDRPDGPCSLYANPQHPQTGRRAPHVPASLRLGKSWSLGIQAPQGHLVYLQGEAVEPKEPRKDAKKDFQITLFAFDEATWTWRSEPMGRLRWPHGFTPILVAEDRLVGVAVNAQTFRQGNKSYLFALFRKNDRGDFCFDRGLESGFDHPPFKPQGGWTHPTLSNLWLQGSPLWCGDRTVFGTGYGLFWVFDEKGSMKRLLRLYPNLSDERLEAEPPLWSGAVLGAQPKADGTLLISALDAKLIEMGAILYSHRPPTTWLPTYQQNQKLVLQELLRSDPRVTWYVLDPADGQIRMELPPQGLPETVASERAFHDFNWVFQPNGHLRFFDSKALYARDPQAPDPLDRILESKTHP